MAKYWIALVVVSFLFLCCNKNKEDKSNVNNISVYTGNIDGITYNPNIDNPNFKLFGDYTYQYFNDGKALIYNGDKPAIEKVFFLQFDTTKTAKESGLVRIRFVVNCKGEADRYRLLAMDKNYNETLFDTSITNQLLTITKSLNGWGIKTIDNQPIDYYQYLIFSIQEGKIVKILP